MKFYQVIFIVFVLDISHIVLSFGIDSNLNGLDSEPIPHSFDWRTKGVITPVRDYSDESFTPGIAMVGK